MRGVKPFRLGLMTRPFQVKNEYWLGVGILAFFPYDQPDKLSTEMEMWQFLPEQMGDDLVLDVGVPKARSEVLIVGSGHQPAGLPNTTLPVRVEIGSIDKTLYLLGDRCWQRDAPTQPRPFTSMKIDWENAFGGEGYDPNPRGKGFAPLTDDDGREIHPLPNVESSGGLITSPKDRPEPAGFRAIDFTWPQRYSMAGTYDKEWMDTFYPGFAKDLDWRIWQMAAADQQQDAPFRSDEHFALHNMHPTQERVEGRLPNLVTRCFVTRTTEQGEIFEEVDTKLTTVWLFPESHKGVLVFHAGLRVTEDDATDVVNIMICGERPGQPRPIEHYKSVLAKRLDPENLIETLNDDDLMPQGLTGLSPEVERAKELTSIEGLRGERQKTNAEKKIEEKRAWVESLGLDVDEHGPAPIPDEDVPPLAELPEFLKKKLEEAEAAKVQGEKDRAIAIANAKKFYAEAGFDFEEVEEEMAAVVTGPPSFTADGHRAMLQRMREEVAELGHESEELEFYVTDPELYRQWQEQETQGREGYRIAAHFQSPAPSVLEALKAPIREDVENAHRRGESFAERDLTGADLSGMDLSGADFSGAMLESVSFEAARLEDVNFDRAVLAHANLTTAQLGGARFRGANLGKAKIVCAEANRPIDLTDAILWETDLTGSVLRGATLEGVNFFQANLESTDLRDAQASRAVFFKCRMKGAKLTGADVSAGTFMELDMPELDFGGATLHETVFLKCNGRACSFVNANAVNVRIVLESDFSGSDFRGVIADKANFRGVNLAGADFSGAKLNGTDLSESNLEGAKLYRIVARESMWVRANLQGAQLVSADLLGAVLQKADLRGTDLRGANLYAADFALIRSDSGTNVTDAIQDKVRILPKREQ